MIFLKLVDLFIAEMFACKPDFS